LNGTTTLDEYNAFNGLPVSPFFNVDEDDS
jgi:polyamine oxidase